MWCRFKHPVGQFPCSKDHGDEEEDFTDIPDVRDVNPHMKRQRELHPKYKSEYFWDFIYSILISLQRVYAVIGLWAIADVVRRAPTCTNSLRHLEALPRS